MAGRLKWDQAGERLYETGVDRGVLYPITNGSYGTGVAWNGLTAVNDSPSGGEVTKLYADNLDYLSLMSVEELGLSVEAYTYPDEFAACDGSAAIATGVTIGQQTRKHFGFIYRSLIGNDEDGTDYGYKIHIVFDCLASPSEKQHSTVNDSPEATSLSWDFSTSKVQIGDKFTACVEIDSTKVDSAKLTTLEDWIYGKDATTGENAQAATDPAFPTPSKLLEIFGTT